MSRIAPRDLSPRIETVMSLRTRRSVVIGLWLGALLGGCGGAPHGHWTDPGARLVDGMWIGPPITCPTARDECAVVASAAPEGLSAAERSQIVKIAEVEPPSHFETDGGEPRTPLGRIGIRTFAAALVTLDSGRERVVGLNCQFPYGRDGQLRSSDAECMPMELVDWRDGAVPPSFPPGTTFG
jgi:hypothetical protein